MGIEEEAFLHKLTIDSLLRYETKNSHLAQKNSYLHCETVCTNVLTVMIIRCKYICFFLIFVIYANH